MPDRHRDPAPIRDEVAIQRRLDSGHGLDESAGGTRQIADAIAVCNRVVDWGLIARPISQHRQKQFAVLPPRPAQPSGLEARHPAAAAEVFGRTSGAIAFSLPASSCTIAA